MVWTILRSTVFKKTEMTTCLRSTGRNFNRSMWYVYLYVPQSYMYNCYPLCYFLSHVFINFYTTRSPQLANSITKNQRVFHSKLTRSYNFLQQNSSDLINIDWLLANQYGVEPVVHLVRQRHDMSFMVCQSIKFVLRWQIASTP